MIEAAWNTYAKWPLPLVRTLGPEYWKKQRYGDRHGPDRYEKLQPESMFLLAALMKLAVPTDSFLDVGSGSGRHLKALRRAGFSHVYGIDVRPCREEAMFIADFADWLPHVTCEFDVVFTFGMTIELVPPSVPICSHMARIAKKAVVLMVFERGCPYPRLWKQEFEREGMRPTHYEPHGQMGLFTFEWCS